MFGGNPGELELFLERMEQIHMHIKVIYFNKITERNITKVQRKLIES